MATRAQILQMQVLAKISAILASTHICQTANVLLKLWLAQVQFGKCDENRYSHQSSLASMTKIGIRLMASLVQFGKFGQFGEFSECKLDRLILIKYVNCTC